MAWALFNSSVKTTWTAFASESYTDAKDSGCPCGVGTAVENNPYHGSYVTVLNAVKIFQ